MPNVFSVFLLKIKASDTLLYFIKIIMDNLVNRTYYLMKKQFTRIEFSLSF